MTFHPQRAVELLVCPQSHAELIYDGKSLVSTDPLTRLRYPVRDDIPVMLIDEADVVPLREWADLMSKHGRDPESGQIRQGGSDSESPPVQEEPS